MDTLELDGSIASVCTTTASIAISIASRAGIQVSELRHTHKYIIMHSHQGGGHARGIWHSPKRIKKLRHAKPELLVQFPP